MIRRLKLTYWLYNLFNRKPLEHNLGHYRKLGMQKSYFSPVSSKDFHGRDPQLLEPEPVKALEETALYTQLGAEAKESLRQFHETGYALLPGYLDGETVDRINAEIQTLQDSGQLSFTYGNKLMFAIRKSPFLSGIWTAPKLLELLSSLIPGNARLFQSINFLQGSQQRTHSDSIHMTTFPLGGLLGVWLALEDIEADQGPLHYYPGSHKLPYFLNASYENEGDWAMIGDKTYKQYEEMIQEKIASADYEKEVFLARKGDLFIWHANLLHGGEPHTNPGKSRKSMVLHYFDGNRVCYHEITQRPALFK